MKFVEIYTDGACSGNPGPGGWAAILKFGNITKEISGFMPLTTNNRMELMAVISGIGALKEPCNLKIYSDSAYVVNAFNEKWIDNWQKNNWVKSDKKKVENDDLWKLLLLQIKSKKHNVEFVKVKGHSDNEYNNLCDKLAKEAIEEYINLNKGE